MTHKNILLAGTAIAVCAASCCEKPSGEFQFDLLTTNDVHGSWFPVSYTDGKAKNSLMAINTYVNEYRDSLGAENVILFDAGDCLQGDNAAYYFNYVDTADAHLYPRLASYMGYDAVCVGNHDIETGHKVYDRVTKDLKKAGIPFFGGNALKPNGKPYFEHVRMLKCNGVKIALLGYTNPNMKAWLDESLWTGMTFESLIPVVQNDVDKIIAREHPQVVIVGIHSGTGPGDGSSLESQGRDLLKTLSGVDFLICSHDHSAITIHQDSICLINSGSHARNIGHGRINLTLDKGKVVAKTISSEIIRVDAARTDTAMFNAFAEDFEKVRAFTMREVGTLDTDLVTRDSYAGMCPYMNLIHTLSLTGAGAQISFAAPLTFNRTVPAGKLIYNDLFTIYPYENQLYSVKMSGNEIKDYLEYSYDTWIFDQPEYALSQDSGVAMADAHVLKILAGEDQRSGQLRWHFINRSYNFDSAAGLNYTVDVTKPYGERVSISTLADGSAFSADSTYLVAMTSYRAAGGGDLLSKGAGIDTDNMDDRIVGRYQELRNVLYDYLTANGGISADKIGDPTVIGHWEFVPEAAHEAVARDMRLLFGGDKE